MTKRSRSPLPFSSLSLSLASLLRSPLLLPMNHLDKRHRSRPVVSYFDAPHGAPALSCRRQATPWSEPMSSLSASASTSPRTGRSGPPPSTPMHPRAPSPPRTPRQHLQPCEQPPHGSLTGVVFCSTNCHRGATPVVSPSPPFSQMGSPTTGLALGPLSLPAHVAGSSD
jgi:hypothetical protein